MFHDSSRLRRGSIQISRPCHTFGSLLENGAASRAKRDQGPLSRAAAWQAIRPYRSDTAKSQSLGRGITVGMFDSMFSYFLAYPQQQKDAKYI